MPTSSGSSPSSPMRRSPRAMRTSLRRSPSPMSGYRNLSRFISAAAALALFIGSWHALHHGWLSRNQIVDTPVYENYGDRMATWHAPYLDFGVEYPPGALPV